MGNQHVTLFNRNKNNFQSILNVPLDDINIIWLDAYSDEKSFNNLTFISELHQIFSNIRTFIDPNLCEIFLKNNVHDNQIIFLIVSGSLGELFVPCIHELPCISSIYVFCQDKIRHEFWSNKYSKLKNNIFVEIPSLCHQLEQDIRQCQNDLTPIHILNKNVTDEQLNQLEPSFMYSQLLKEILINIKYDKNAKQEFIQFIYSQFNNQLSEKQVNAIQEFENDYEKHTPISWYTRESIVYTMLNKALRTGHIDSLIKMAFFIRDLHQQIEQLHSSQEHHSMIVYRGQGMSSHQFEKLSNSKGGLIAFHHFLSTSLDKRISLKFARHAIEKPGICGVIFHMKIDPNKSNSSNPYASIKDYSYYENSEKEILFSTHTVFRIKDIQPMKDENKIWEVYLELTTYQDDIQLEQLSKYLRQDVQSTSDPWESLGKLLLTLGEFDKAQEIFENILQKTADNDYKQLAFLYHQLGYISNEKKDFNQAFEYFQQSISLKENYSTEEQYLNPRFADTYLNMGCICYEQGNFHDALIFFQYALEMNLDNQKFQASLYNNIGKVYAQQRDYKNALEYFQKSLQIDSQRLPSTHFDLATIYSNIASVYSALEDYENALSNYKIAFVIYHSSLPPNHPYLQRARTSYDKIARILSIDELQSDLSVSVRSDKHLSNTKIRKRSNKLTKKVSACYQAFKRRY